MTDKNECEINKISVWENSASLPQFPTLDGDIHTDVLIIGGGIAGILTAYFLNQNDVKYVLVDKGRICSGITHNTTAKITAQHGLIYHKIFAEVFNPSRSILKPQLFANGFEATKNLLTVSEHRCPHLGCALKWNRAENSWDCPCHGSRFTESGEVLDNPANGTFK